MQNGNKPNTPRRQPSFVCWCPIADTSMGRVHLRMSRWLFPKTLNHVIPSQSTRLPCNNNSYLLTSIDLASLYKGGLVFTNRKLRHKRKVVCPKSQCSLVLYLSGHTASTRDECCPHVPSGSSAFGLFAALTCPQKGNRRSRLNKGQFTNAERSAQF